MTSNLLPVYNANKRLVGKIARDAFPTILAFDFKTLLVGERLVTVEFTRKENIITAVCCEKAGDLYGHPKFELE